MRAMNRAPSPRDPWWAEHQRSCGGTYIKTKEPESYKIKREKAGISRTKEMNKGHTLGSGVRRIDDMFSPIGAKDNIPEASVAPTLRDMDNKSKVVNAPSSIPVEDNQGSIRSKMLAAAEKRQKESERKRLDSYSRKRPPPSDSSLSQSSSQETSVCKRMKFEPSSGQPVGQTDSSKPLDLNRVTYSTEQGGISDHCTPSTSQVIDLSGDVSLTPSPPDYPLEDTNKEDRKVILIDDSQELETMFRTCPVCGVSNIPAAIINSHVSFCLDEDSQSLYID